MNFGGEEGSRAAGRGEDAPEKIEDGWRGDG